MGALDRSERFVSPAVDPQPDCTSAFCEGLKERGITFDNENSVWALSCIGAWVGIIYNQAKDGKGLSKQPIEFFRNVFRDDESFRSFPTNTIFSPDWFGYLDALQDFLCRAARVTEMHSCREK